MQTEKLLVLSLLCLCIQGLPNPTSLFDRDSSMISNTIFADERLPGEIFEDIDDLSDAELTSRNSDPSPYRLPTTTKPSHYKILWVIDLSLTEPTQSGTVDITLHATQANVNEIVIHFDGMTLTRVELKKDGDDNRIPVTFRLDTTYQFLRIRRISGFLDFDPETPVDYTLSIGFGANIRNDMYGIYKTWYRNDPNGAVRWMASTQFQATSARLAFPCYDEPSFKATFDITIRHHISYQSWSCTRLKDSIFVDHAPGYIDDVYHTTPVMSTYLLAFIVAEYDSLTVLKDGDLSYEVIARPGAISNGQGDYALITGQKLLAEMSTHTAIDFYDQHPQLKMTQAAIPDFFDGAMENWGLLTYREAYLMYDDRETNSYYKQLIAYILSHEIAHMWFGNLVTCDWWDNLWLNEGFARYYQYYLTYWVEDMGLDTRFITEQVHTALLSDSANSPHPLTNPGRNSNTAVRAMFSTISYNKGAAIIRMTEHLLGFEVHRQGLINYLKGREYQTGLPSHLFQYQEEAALETGALNYGSSFSFTDYFKSWTEQPGHPVLNVHVDHQTGKMTVFQTRFNINTGYSTAETQYIVPITFATASNPIFYETKPTHILSTESAIIDRGSVGDEWVIFNVQQTGFYRVNYDPYTWDLIAIALQSTDGLLIHENNRAQIVNDVFQFARSGIMKYRRALNILSFLENETDYAPWVAAMTGFSWLRGRLAIDSTADQLEALNELIIEWASKVMDWLTYEPSPVGESFMMSYLRYQLAPVMCNLGVPECIQVAKDQFQALRVSNTSVPVDSRHWVYCNGLRYGNASDFDFLWDRFQKFNVYTEKILILQNLGCTKDPDSLRTFMQAIVQDNFIIRPQDYSAAFSSAVNGNEENTMIAFEFIQNNLLNVINAFGSASTPLSYISSRLRSQESIDNFLLWAEENEHLLENDYERVISDAQLTRQSRIWTELILDDIDDYLQNGGDPITTTTTTTPSTTTIDTTEETTEYGAETTTEKDDQGEVTDEVPDSGTTAPEPTNTDRSTVPIIQQPPITEPVTPSLPTTSPGSLATNHGVSAITIVFTLIAYTAL